MNRENSSFEECGQNLMATRGTTNGDEEERVVTVHDRRDSVDFDLCENYQSAIDCIVQCEYIIKTLQEQLASKDERIASKDEKIALKDEQIASKDEQIVILEEKLVRMSFELASPKALPDEQLHRFKSRTSIIENSSVEDKGERDTPPSRQQQQNAKEKVQGGQAAEMIVDFAPVNKTQRNCPTECKLRHRHVRTRSLPAMDDCFSQAMTAEKHHPEPRQRGGFRLPRLAERMSWNKIGDSTPSLTALDDSAKDSMSLSNFGQFIKGLHKNDKTKVAEAADQEKTNDEDDSPGHTGSSQSVIPGVIFPVSSDDCLVGLLQRSRRRYSNVNKANTNWE
eukprot:CAMPEP_0201874224 /NCGR_PEP_ID=MMETSP0902-20130614/6530_1 /ASSEMBLY_ACC=CAM_ASM_000551 /TAXON_ID=420261 /ORGANISM="Thalassiosira antarctica, Strain CCMP982" /LENGTH=336 /DNA_ID=CAMNT_0048401041 /DNA_START=148 /DNA_END=1158 /DNA_ORIENTATION=-